MRENQLVGAKRSSKTRARNAGNERDGTGTAESGFPLSSARLRAPPQRTTTSFPSRSHAAAALFAHFTGTPSGAPRLAERRPRAEARRFSGIPRRGGAPRRRSRIRRDEGRG